MYALLAAVAMASASNEPLPLVPVALEELAVADLAGTLA
jgi:hypothetical protein